MSSIAEYHFPRYRWRNGEKRLWNPIARKTFSDRPEERVRLRILDALIEAGWSKNRISTEETISNGSRRTDIICYDKNFKPYLLIECKAESVPITGKVAEQTARYNLEVGAGQLLMSNGKADHWFRIDGEKRIEMRQHAPELLKVPGRRAPQEFGYWQERLFAGDGASMELQTWITPILNSFWLRSEEEVRYIDFQKSPGGFDLAHYFKIVPAAELRLAITFSGDSRGSTKIITVFNREKKNVGLLEVDLDRLLNEKAPNGIFYSENRTDRFDMKKYVADLLENPAQSDVSVLPSLLTSFFKKHG